MLYSCTHVTTVGVKGVNYARDRERKRFLLNLHYCLFVDMGYLNLETTEKQNKQTMKYGKNIA